ncbi:MAG: hypothetical protein E7K04_00260 [Helicobacter sp.]|nr:hypothetical protein [Helicobacter sp.]
MAVIKKALLVLLFGISFSYDYIDEALKNGENSGDLMIYGDFLRSKSRLNITPNKLATYSYLDDTSYLVGQTRLEYISGFYKLLRLKIGFGFMFPLYNGHNNLQSSFGKLDYQKDFFNRNEAQLSESFLEYFDGDTNIKIGRLDLKDNFNNGLIDGIAIKNKSLKDLLLEAQYMRNFGRSSYFEMSNFARLDPLNIGLFKLIATYDLKPKLLDLSAYISAMYKSFISIGAKSSASLDIDNFKLQGELGALGLINIREQDSSLIHAKITLKYKNLADLTLAGANSSKAGLGNINILGDMLLPVFDWGAKAFRTQSNASAIFLQSGFNMRDFTLSIAYGFTFFNQKELVNELNINSNVYLTNNVSLVINLANTHIQSSFPTYTQLNGGVRFKF